MRVIDMSELHQRQLRPIAESPSTAISIDTALSPGIDVDSSQSTSFERSASNVAARLHSVSGMPVDSAYENFESLKKAVREYILPFLQSTTPGEKLFITGVQAVFATDDFWRSISIDATSVDAKLLKGVSIAQLLANAYLTYSHAEELPKTINGISGLIVSTANKVLAFTD